jgi:long-chain acyl-CoA synthetase
MATAAWPSVAASPPTALPQPSTSARNLVFDPDQFKGFHSLAEAFFYNATANPLAVAFDQAQDAPADVLRPYRVSTNAERKKRVLQVAAYLELVGVRRDDKVAILSFERPEWTEAEMAAFALGAVIVPAYVRDNEERLGFILRDSGASYAFVENQEQVKKMLRICAEGGIKLRKIISFEDFHVKATAVPPDLLTSWSTILKRPFPAYDAIFPWPETRREDLAQIGYTSGSSGLPKGVPVTHGQILANLWQMSHAGLIDYNRFIDPRRELVQPFVTLLLPERAHAYPGRIAELCATTPTQTRYPAIVDRKHSRIDQNFRDSIRRDLREGAAGIVPIVPKLLITLQQRVKERLISSGIAGRLLGKLFSGAAEKLLHESRGEPRKLSDLLSSIADPLRKRIARRIRRTILGPHFEFFIAGGAKLPVETAAFLWALEIPVYEGYGTTETNCPIATNVPAHSRLGSVGLPFVGVDARVDDQTGELLIRGPNLAAGYWNSSSETAASWCDGWYHTRDIGRVDDDGYLYISDRIDNILVLQNGENVSAAEIEGRFSEIPYVETVVVLGHQRPGLIALVALNEDAVQRWAERNGHVLISPLKNNSLVLELLRLEMEIKVNRRARRYFDQIRALAIIDPLGTQEQTLTATEKTNRRMIQKQYAALIEELYSESHRWQHVEPGEVESASQAPEEPIQEGLQLAPDLLSQTARRK